MNKYKAKTLLDFFGMFYFSEFMWDGVWFKQMPYDEASYYFCKNVTWLGS